MFMEHEEISSESNREKKILKFILVNEKKGDVGVAMYFLKSTECICNLK